ncbi:MAG: ribosomal RNA small subunit methyltransferase A [Alphaproteobacteria bacterium]|nr:ribosomal RNA small subunit methyltransferase A [Alphaproteobacteria bacterium]
MAKKALGQNFLLDSNIVDKIMRLSLNEQGFESLENQNVIEIGPGPGGLTQAVLRCEPSELKVIEMDERCLSILGEIKEAYPNLNIISGDALKFDWDEEFRLYGKKHIVSNLPYNISVVLLCGWLEKINQYKSLTLMFQKEVADRILADTGTKDYGRVSVLAQLQTEVVKLFDISPKCFVPEPKIWSTVLLFKPKEKVVEGKVLEMVSKLTAEAFSKRRKMIRQSLKNIPNILEILNELDIEPTLRAENLSPNDYLEIAERLV